MYTLSEIWTYPVKSMAGIALHEAVVQRRGLQYDRRWMMVDEAGRFLSQREIPELALLQPSFHDNQLKINHKSKSGIQWSLPLKPEISGMVKLRVQIWSDRCAGLLMPDNTNEWFSDVLGHHVRLVYMPDTTRRRADGRYAPKGQYVSFADGFPFLVISEASLADLNARLHAPVPMNRFRPNFVVAGSSAFEEDQWSDFQIGGVPFRGVKPCGRCTIVTTDQNTGSTGKEPLKTLSEYRKIGNKVCFGQNVIWMGEGTAVVRVGDIMTIVM